MKPVVAALVILAVGCSQGADEVLERAAEHQTARAVGAPAPGIPRVAANHAFTKVSARELLASESSTLLALSPEEARWLDAHGFPTAEELAAVASMDTEALEAAVRNGRDARAAALLGIQRLLADDLHGASVAFAVGSSHGSLFAREQLAIVDLQRAVGLSREQLANTFMHDQLAVFAGQIEVAKMLGDHRAQVYLDRYAGAMDASRHADDVLRHAAEFMRQHGEDARVRGVAATGPDPRPNAGLWKEMQERPDMQVAVYDRHSRLP
jgi:hypothetical protein